jgi:protocatechuate 3,4-dioxygenase beta subunit
MIARALSPRAARRAWAWLLAAACVGAAIGGLAVAQPPAEAETGTPSGSGGANCPASNPPNTLALTAGTPQTAALEQAFATGLQVALMNSDGCPVTAAAGVPVTFSAPSSGASGLFSGGGSNTVTVGSDASGTAAAPTFTANDAAGSYAVTAISQYGSVSFSLTNTAAGIPARIVTTPLRSRSARVASEYPQPLQVKVLDADGNPVAGATVTFTLGASTGRASACGATSSAGASFIGGAAQASTTTGSSGVATSPPFTANDIAGSVTATAAASDGGSAAGSGGANPAGAGSAIRARFALANIAGAPAKVTAGIAATESAAVGTRFPIRLAVTVTDGEKNPVAGASVTFTAPASGPGGRFTTHSRGSRRHRPQVSHLRVVEVKTDACGVAVAPPFTAELRQGGYVVKATAGHARPAAFALVNEAPGQLP